MVNNILVQGFFDLLYREFISPTTSLNNQPEIFVNTSLGQALYAFWMGWVAPKTHREPVPG